MAAEGDEALERALERAKACDAIVHSAVSETSRRNFGDGDFSARITENDTAVRWNIDELAQRYLDSRTYPTARLPGVIDRAIDTKLQFRFVSITLGLGNTAVFEQGFDLAKPLETPRLHLIHLSIQQCLIGQVRVLWERVMTLVFYLETGEDPRGKSVRKVFFRGIDDWAGRWDVFKEWAAVIGNYDGDYRTPEFHTRSRLRKELFGHDPVDPNELIAPLMPIMNGFWETLTAHVQGIANPVRRFGWSTYSGLDE